MNRRSFVAAVPALMPAMAFAQEATSAPAPRPVDILRRYIDEVRQNGNADLIYDMFAGDDVEEIYWRHVRSFADLNADYDEFDYRAAILVGDDTYAMAYVVLWTWISDDATQSAFSLAIKVEDGRIIWSRQLDG